MLSTGAPGDEDDRYPVDKECPICGSPTATGPDWASCINGRCGWHWEADGEPEQPWGDEA